MHFFLIASQFATVFLDNNKNDLFTKILRTVEIFLYQGVLLYEQFYIGKTIGETNEGDPEFVTIFKQWMLMEVVFYYLQIVNASIFLLFISIRGSLNKKELKSKSNELRYKSDAIEYYELDIDWFSFQFVLFSTHLNAFLGRSYILKHGLFGDIEQQILCVLMLQRIVQFILIRKLRDQQKEIVVHSNAYWLILAFIQLIAFVLFFQKKSTDIINSMFWIDTIVLLFQAMFYKVTFQAQHDERALASEQEAAEKQLENDIKEKMKSSLEGQLEQ